MDERWVLPHLHLPNHNDLWHFAIRRKKVQCDTWLASIYHLDLRLKLKPVQCTITFQMAQSRGLEVSQSIEQRISNWQSWEWSSAESTESHLPTCGWTAGPHGFVPWSQSIFDFSWFTKRVCNAFVLNFTYVFATIEIQHDHISPFACSWRRFTMHRFLTHDSIKEGIFNRDFCSATSAYSAWPAELTNNDEILELVLQRLQSDWLACNPKHRKPWTAQGVDSWIWAVTRLLPWPYLELMKLCLA